MKARNDVTDLGSKKGFAMAATLGVLTLLSVLVVTVTRDYEWQFLPRNLMYERNR